MRIEVTSKCSGHGRCYSLAPDVYEADDDGYNAAIGTEIEVGAQLADSALIGVQMCPEGALVVMDDDHAVEATSMSEA